MGDANVLERILDGAEDPTNLSLQLLKDITGNFSEDRKIGQGGFGEVFRGLLGARIVAVKRIYINENTFDDSLFRREFVSLWNTNHRNVVRFLGFCSNTYQKTRQDAESGQVMLVNVLERLLCFEYIDNGALDKHITDELRGLEWETRYEIIIGICKGLRYLHKEKNIIHMDLKPANILLHLDDKYMVPKITDFGLSRPNEKSHTVGKCYGTRGYQAPEYMEDSKTTPACDVYSLGLIIIELVTGCKDVPNKDNVLRRWRHRWNKPPTQLRYQQVTRCIYIAERCRAQKPEARPSILEIITFLSESESTYGLIHPLLDQDDMLGIKPLELRFPSKFNKEISCSVELTNGTCNCIAFNIQLPSAQYSAQPVKGIVQPKSMCVVTITLQVRDVHEHDHADKFIVQSMQVKATDGLGEDDITECMSRAEAGKVVDEVDLMVVYEPTKPQDDCKPREDTHLPADKVPEDKREIVKHYSRRVKNKLGCSKNAEGTSLEINSGARGQCDKPTEQCNLLPLQSFSRHYPTNKTYLGEESDRAVDSARGAMGSLLDKLGKLVTGDYSLDPSIKSDIESFSQDLVKIHLDLPKLHNVDRAKIFVDEVRELSYNIEDMVDSLLVHVEPNSSRSGFREIMHETVKLVQNGMPTQHQIGDVIRDLKANIKAVAKMKDKYNIDFNATTKATTGLRISAIYEHEERLVGIRTPRDALIRLLQEDGHASKQELKIISIVGMGGLGKTTLAKAVYEELKGYHPKAFVSVGQNPDVETVLKKIIRKCQENCKTNDLDVDDLIDKLREFLEDKRYFIVIDDIWDSTAWKLISSSLPRNKCGSILITTTRIIPVALATCNAESEYVYEMKPLSKEDSRTLFLRRTFGPEIDCPDTPIKEEISKYILKRCDGMPLAINSIASLLAGEPDSTWENVWKSLGALTEGKTERKTDIGNMKEILDLSYMYLPDDLKTCLLYVCKYEEDHEIDKDDLLGQWVAEGFVSRKGRLDAEDVAENNFKALINMCMIQPGKIDYNNEVLTCKVHDLILDLIRSKSTEENFIQIIDGLQDQTGARGEIRRVSVHHSVKEDSSILATIKGSLSHVRSVLLYQSSLVPYFLVFKYVRVLHLEDRSFSNDLDLTGISTLFLLRYLKVTSVIESRYELKLPNKIGELQQLETIDLDGVVLKNYPSDIVSLPWLLHLSSKTMRICNR